MPNPIQKIIIVGGGSAGWMSAAALANALCGQCDITLIESEDIGTVGVGEATIPPIKLFNQQLGINERDFLHHTQGTLKLGIEFIHWGQEHSHYFHPFGTFGADFDRVPLYQYWLREYAEDKTSSLFDFSLAWRAAKVGKIVPPCDNPRLIQATADYAYHFDAGLYARYLRTYSELRGVIRREGKVIGANLNSDTGFIESVTLVDGTRLGADLFIDCSGFSGLLIEEAMNTGYENWAHWLPCNSAIAVPCEKAGDFTPYTKSIAHSAGWQWRIPLQHRTGNGHVYCNSYMSDAQAQDILLGNLDGKIQADPRQLRFTTGHRKQFWNKNCVAIGLAAGFMEPLESTSLHLIQTGINRLLALFPDCSFSPLDIQEYNRITLGEYQGIRDFLILHYKASLRQDSEFWRYCNAMPIPDCLQYKMDHFAAYGRLVSSQAELFLNPSWLAVFLGQGIIPQKIPPLVGKRAAVDAKARLAGLRKVIDETLPTLPDHQTYIDYLLQTAPAAGAAYVG